ncbi:MAG: hypothetical protein K9H48_07640 [Melioribacteraceae bacterium]|nr:hypothetical protein [Melioribacteraceae bacterium]
MYDNYKVYEKYIASLLRQTGKTNLTQQILKNQFDYLRQTFVFQLGKDDRHILVQYEDGLNVEVTDQK